MTYPLVDLFPAAECTDLCDERSALCTHTGDEDDLWPVD